MSDEERKQRISAGTIAGLVILVVVVVFALLNSDRVRIDFLFFDADVRLIFVIIGSALLGAVAGALWRRHSRRRD